MSATIVAGLSRSVSSATARLRAERAWPRESRMEHRLITLINVK
ncbi:MAG: hypothetical protein ACOYUK_03705 [Patescibacteria group bacterium]